MPNQYRVTDPQTGRTVILHGDAPPTEAEIQQVFASLGNVPPIDPMPSHRPQTMPESGRTWTDTLTDALPIAGGAVGGILGGLGGAAFGVGFGGIPGSAGGAALGGAAGEAFKQLANRVRGKAAPSTMTDAASAIAGSGAVEGATDLVGGAAGKYVLSPVAKRMTQFAFRPTQEALKLNPSLVQDILDNSYTLSQKGVNTAKAATNEARQVAEGLVTDLQTKPNRILVNPKGEAYATHRANVEVELLDPVFSKTTAITDPSQKNAMGKVLRGADNQPGLRTAANVRESVEQSLPREVSPKRLLDIKREEGQRAAKIFSDTPDTTTRKSFNADLHNAADAALERRIGPAWSAANKETQRRLVTQEVLQDAVGRQSAEAALPNGYDQFLLMRGLANSNPLDVGLALAREAGRARPLVAAAGRGINQAGKKQVLQQGSRLVREVANEDNQERKARNKRKKELDALWERFQKELR